MARTNVVAMSDARLAILWRERGSSGLWDFWRGEQWSESVLVAGLADVVVDHALLGVRVDHDVDGLRERDDVVADSTLLGSHGVEFVGKALSVLLEHDVHDARGCAGVGGGVQGALGSLNSLGRSWRGIDYPVACPQFHFHSAWVGFKGDTVH